MAFKKLIVSIASALFMVFSAINPILASGSVSGDVKVVDTDKTGISIGDATADETDSASKAFAGKSVIYVVDATGITEEGKVTFNVPGAKGKTVTVYQLVNGEWVAIGTATVGEDGNIVATVKAGGGAIAFVTEKEATSTSKSTVNTGVQSVNPYAYIGLAALACGVMLFALKRKAER